MQLHHFPIVLLSFSKRLPNLKSTVLCACSLRVAACLSEVSFNSKPCQNIEKTSNVRDKKESVLLGGKREAFITRYPGTGRLVHIHVMFLGKKVPSGQYYFEFGYSVSKHHTVLTLF